MAHSPARNTYRVRATRVDEYPRLGEVAAQSYEEYGDHQPDGHRTEDAGRHPLVIFSRRQSYKEQSHGTLGGPDGEEEEEVGGIRELLRQQLSASSFLAS